MKLGNPWKPLTLTAYASHFNGYTFNACPCQSVPSFRVTWCLGEWVQTHGDVFTVDTALRTGPEGSAVVTVMVMVTVAMMLSSLLSPQLSRHRCSMLLTCFHFLL